MRSRVLLFELELQHLAGSGFEHRIVFQQVRFSTRQPKGQQCGTARLKWETVQVDVIHLNGFETTPSTKSSSDETTEQILRTMLGPKESA